MATEVLIPKLGMTMVEGTVAAWRLPDGAQVTPGQIVYSLETEKITFEVEAEASGILRRLVPEGTALPPGSVVAYILAPGEALSVGTGPVPAAAPPAASASTYPLEHQGEGGRIAASPIARRVAREAGLDLAQISGSGPGGRITEQDVLAAQAKPTSVTVAATAPSTGITASPLARRLAEQRGIDLSTVRGSGPGGRITREDVDQTMPVAPLTLPPLQPQAESTGYRSGDVIPMRSMRRVIAERMRASLQEMAQLTLGIQVVMDEAVNLRTQLTEEWEREGIRPSYTDLIARAVIKALPHCPALNARVSATGIELLPQINIGLAVALADGLVVPVIRDAGQLTLKEIAREAARLAGAARAGRLTLDEMAGGSFSITSLGMYEIDFFTPIINPPNTGILGVGRIHDATGWEGNRPVQRRELTLSLTIDHRAIDGAPAADFLRLVRDLLQAPYRLLV